MPKRAIRALRFGMSGVRFHRRALPAVMISSHSARYLGGSGAKPTQRPERLG